MHYATLDKKRYRDREFRLALRSFSEGGRQMLDPNTPSIKFDQVTPFVEIQQTHKEVVVKYGQLPDSGKGHGFNVFSPSFAATILNHAARQSEREAERVINTVLQIPKVLSLGTLLDSRNGGGDLGPANQSPGDGDMKKKRKKKRRVRL